MKLKLRGDLVFVRPLSQPDRSDAGLHLVYDHQQSTVRGNVVAVGDGPYTANGVLLPHFVSVGDDIVFSPESGEELIFEKETLIALREWDVLAIIDK